MAGSQPLKKQKTLIPAPKPVLKTAQVLRLEMMQASEPKGRTWEFLILAKHLPTLVAGLGRLGTLTGLNVEIVKQDTLVHALGTLVLVEKVGCPHCPYCRRGSMDANRPSNFFPRSSSRSGYGFGNYAGFPRNYSSRINTSLPYRGFYRTNYATGYQGSNFF